MIIPILSQTPFNFSYLASPATEDVIVADRIPVAGARTVALSVRVHKLSLSSGASFRFFVYGVDPSPTDGTVFISSSSIGDTGAISSANPNLIGLSAIISDPTYPFIRVVLQAAGPGSTGTVYFELSADLVVRQAAAAMTAEQAFVQSMFQSLYSERPPEGRGTLSEFADSIMSDPGGTASPPQPLPHPPAFPPNGQGISKGGLKCNPAPHTQVVCAILAAARHATLYCPK